jgi:hypothetical protein
MPAYSFADVAMTLTGPGGVVSLGNGTPNPAVSLGYGAGVDDAGITIEYEEDRGKLDIGADGQPMHTLRTNASGTVTVRLQKTSPMNAVLMDMYNYQTLSSLNWGQNVIVISDPALGDIITCNSVAFKRAPNITYAQDANANEWAFLVGQILPSLG